MKVTSNSLGPHGLYSSWNSLAQNTGVGSLSFLQGIFPTQGLNPGLPHCRQILYQLSHKGSPRYWSGWPVSSPADLPDPGIKPGSPALQADSLSTELLGNWIINREIFAYLHPNYCGELFIWIFIVYLKWNVIRCLYEFGRTAITQYHSLSDFDNRNFLPYSSRG